MKICYSNQPFEIANNSIFLAGPTPRRQDVKSWRPQALEILDHFGYPGTVYVPEWMDYTTQVSYLGQVEWEYSGLQNARVIAFWVPRDLETLPGFTTNVEFGRYVNSGRARYGRPDGAPNTRYLDWLYDKMTSRKPTNSLEALLKEAVELSEDRESIRDLSFLDLDFDYHFNK